MGDTVEGVQSLRVSRRRMVRLLTLFAGMVLVSACAAADSGSELPQPADVSPVASTTTSIPIAATSSEPPSTTPSSAAPEPEDPSFDPAAWVGKVIETRRVSDSSVRLYADGVVTDLLSWGGGCIGDRCDAAYELVVPDGTDVTDPGYPLMIWLEVSVSPPGAEVPQWKVIEAESVDVPPSFTPNHECSRSSRDPETIVIAIVDSHLRTTPLWAWQLGISSGIAPIEPGDVTCYVSGD